jgi:SAM-dependent methyltransferase
MGRTISSDSATWRRYWLEAKSRSPINRRERRGDSETMERWSDRAPSYAEHSESEASQARRGWILEWLEGAGALQPGYRVLDIGAGPGNYAIPMAGKTAEVTAVEPARGMAAILERRIDAAGIGNIHIVEKTWEEVDLQVQGWKAAFDLVFASMSPGVSHPDMVEKMIDASRSFCYLSGWSGERWGKWGLAQAELWPQIFGEELGDYPSDVLYPFGMVYASGYRPELRFVRPGVHLEMEEEQVIRELTDHFDRYVEVDDKIRRTIHTYVRARSRGGMFSQEYTTCQGFLLWSVAGR